MNLEHNGKVAFGSSAKDDYLAINSKKISLDHAAILPLHCELCRQEDGSLNLEVSQDAMVYINSVPIINTPCTLRAGDSILIGFSTLFAVYDGGSIPNFRFLSFSLLSLSTYSIGVRRRCGTVQWLVCISRLFGSTIPGRIARRPAACLKPHGRA